MDKYKLVIFGSDWDVYQVAYKDLIENPHVIYIPTFRPKGLLGQLQRIQFNPKLNDYITMPGKRLWNPYHLKGIKDEKMCFLIQEQWLRIESGIRLLPYLRKNYPDSRIVCFTQDLIETIKDHYTHRQIDVKYIKHYVDLWISFDTADAQKYDIVYHPTVYSPLDNVWNNEKTCYDLYFLGRDKGRMNLLIDICNTAKANGVRCYFLLLGIPFNERITCEGIYYIEKPISYKENLQNCANSRCIVEVLQHDATSPTFRLWECICLNKKLLSNNKLLTELDVYDDHYISIFHNSNDIDWNFVKEDTAYPSNQNPYIAKIRPTVLVRFIEEQQKIKIEL